jgi:predicted phosphodiesterase
MKIQYLSDLHIELMDENNFKKLCEKIVPKCDILVLAGDIGNPLHHNDKYKSFLHLMSDRFKKVFLITGNHEYYQNDIIQTNNKVREICSNRSNLSFLDNTTELYNGHRFIGSTQWTHISDPKYLITDFTAIKKMDVSRYNNLHKGSLLFLKESIDKATANNEKSIVITHHVPLNELTHEKYKIHFMARYNQCFSADLSEIIDKQNTIQSWFYGHTHTKTDQTLYNIPFHCNPLGYDGENNEPDINCVVDV